MIDDSVYLLENDKLRLWVAPEDGMNIYQIEFDDETVVKFDKDHGVPILYPTPNRVRDLKFSFHGVQYDANMHGFTKHQKFESVEISKDENEVSIEGIAEINKGSTAYRLFPFVSSLRIKITIDHNEIRYQYSVYNHDEKKLPYGFAIHPFFFKNHEKVKIQVNAENVMSMTEDNLPTGDLMAVNHTEFQLQEAIDVDELQLDHVYTNIHKHPVAKITYSKFYIEMDTTDDFSHIVVYTPKNQPFFCIENQTCSTDAHNMYNKGFETISGLEIVEPDEEKCGQIIWKFISNN